MTRTLRIREGLHARVFEVVERAAVPAEKLVDTHGGHSDARGITPRLDPPCARP